MSSVQHGVPMHSVQSTGEPAWLRRTLIAIALLFVATFLILPLAAVFTEALRKGFDAFFEAFKEPDAYFADYGHHRTSEFGVWCQRGLGDCQV